MNLPAWFTSKRRQWLYGIVTAALAVLVTLKVVDPSFVPVWLGLAAAALGIATTGTATVATKVQRRNGTLPD